MLTDLCLFLQVIVDECGMCKEPEGLIPIIAHQKTLQQIILIGDHKQLQPIILDPTAARLGLDRSMFERYSTQAHMLTVQYRMVGLTCSLSNCNNV